MTSDNASGIQTAVFNILTEIGEDMKRDGLIETPARFEKHLRECLAGYAADPTDHVKLFDNQDFHDIVTISKISFSSLCEHHLLPFYGYIDVAYIPGEKILGLSKFARIIDIFSRRLQVQERLTQELATFFQKHLGAELLMVRVRATHTCMTARGVERPESITETVVTLGDITKHSRHVTAFQSMR